MDFELSEDQQLLKQTCERYFADHYQFKSRQRYAHEPRGWSLICWKHYAELGLLGVPFAEGYGGLGGGPVETMIGIERPVDFYTIIEAAKRRGETAFGYCRPRGDKSNPSGVTLNPSKAQAVDFRVGDYIVVLAQD